MARTPLKSLLAASILATAAFAAPALAGNHHHTSASHSSAESSTAVMGATAFGPNIVETAASVDDLSTLVAAVQAADLVDALSGEGSFTVFAPTNAAFDALPHGTVSTLLRPENKGQLSNILTSHVVAGSFDAATLSALAEANDGRINLTTLSGANLKVYLRDSAVYVKDERGGKAKVAVADVGTSNGTVHVVTSVLLPH